jgi:hypothetical protein
MQVYTLLIVYSGIFWSKHIAFVRFTEKTVGVVIVIDHLHTFNRFIANEQHDWKSTPLLSSWLYYCVLGDSKLFLAANIIKVCYKA